MSKLEAALDRLPYEIQLMITRQTMVYNKPIAMSDPASRRFKDLRDVAAISRNDLALLAVSHSFRAQAWPVFWSENSFWFDADPLIRTEQREEVKVRPKPPSLHKPPADALPQRRTLCLRRQPRSTLALIRYMVADICTFDLNTSAWNRYDTAYWDWPWAPLFFRAGLARRRGALARPARRRRLGARRPA